MWNAEKRVKKCFLRQPVHITCLLQLSLFCAKKIAVLSKHEKSERNPGTKKFRVSIAKDSQRLVFSTEFVADPLVVPRLPFEILIFPNTSPINCLTDRQRRRRTQRNHELRSNGNVRLICGERSLPSPSWNFTWFTGATRSFPRSGPLHEWKLFTKARELGGSGVNEETARQRWRTR